MPKKSTLPQQRQRRGFAVMSKAKRHSICCLGGKATSKKYGPEHMSKIGKKGRKQRTINERRARRHSNQ